MSRYARSDAAHVAVLDEDFVDRFVCCRSLALTTVSSCSPATPSSRRGWTPASPTPRTPLLSQRRLCQGRRNTKRTGVAHAIPSGFEHRWRRVATAGRRGRLAGTQPRDLSRSHNAPSVRLPTATPHRSASAPPAPWSLRTATGLSPKAMLQLHYPHSGAASSSKLRS